MSFPSYIAESPAPAKPTPTSSETPNSTSPAPDTAVTSLVPDAGEVNLIDDDVDTDCPASEWAALNPPARRAALARRTPEHQRPDRRERRRAAVGRNRPRATERHCD